MKNTILLILSVLLFSEIFALTTYVVTKSTDVDPFEHPYKFNDADCDPEMYGTLQWAINKANDDNDHSRIEFNIPGSGVHEIVLLNYLPQIKTPTIIDATTQSGYTDGNPAIIISGKSQTSVFNAYNTEFSLKGVHINTIPQNGILLTNCTNGLIENNVISHFTDASTKTPFIGIFINGCENIAVFGNEIEVRLEETVFDVTKAYGIYVSKSSNCIIGGIESGDGNIIKNCRTYGVFLNSTQTTKISGNSIYGCGKAIYLNSSNENKHAPIISDYTNGILTGSATPYNFIEVFGSTGEENANEYLTRTNADSNGDWSVELSTSFDYFVTTQRDNGNNSSPLSNILDATQNNCITPEKPTNIIVYDVGKSTAKVSWSPVNSNNNEEITYYWVVDTIPEPVFQEGILHGNTTLTFTEISNLDMGNLYYFGIFASTDCDNSNSEYAYSEYFKTTPNNSIFIKLKDNISNYEKSQFDSLRNVLLSKDEVFYFKCIYNGLNNDTLNKFYHLGCSFNENNILKTLEESLLFENVFFEPKIELSLSCDKNCVSSINPTGDQNIIDNNYIYDMLNLPCAWQITQGNPAIANIAVLDHKFYYYSGYHIDLVDKIPFFHKYDWDVDKYIPVVDPDIPDNPDDPVNNAQDHAIAVSGIIAANPGNDFGLTGAGYNLNVNAYEIPASIGGNEEQLTAYMSDLHSLITLAAENENKVINISLRYICYSDFVQYNTNWTFNLDSIFYKSIIDRGSIVVVAAGNDYLVDAMFSGDKRQIANIPGVIIVGGIDQNNKVPLKHDGSIPPNEEDVILNDYAFAINEYVKICAPARGVMTTRHIPWLSEPDIYTTFGGTSAAAPYVSATVGLMLSANPNLSPADIETILISTSEDIVNNELINSKIQAYNNFLEEHGTYLIDYFKAGSLNSYSAVLMAQNYSNYHKNYIDEEDAIYINSEKYIGKHLEIDGSLTINSSVSIISNNPRITINNNGNLTINANGNILANELDFFYGKIVINSGGTMRINTGVNLNFYDAEIKVKKGGTLIIDGAVITNNCGDLWKGITVEGDYGDEDGPGRLYIRNNASIEYAEIAVNSDRDGVVGIRSSNFINCPVGVQLYDYDQERIEFGEFPYLRPRAYISNSNFITDENFILEPIYHVRLKSLDKIYLKGNNYSNLATNTQLNNSSRGIGVYSLNTGLRVTEYRHFFGSPNSPMTPEDKSHFEGLHYGIVAENTIPQVITIRNCDFVDYKKIGAYISSFYAPEITTNTFTSNETGDVAGLYMQNCSAYHVENNTFNVKEKGLIVSESSTFSNHIYRNTFNNNKYSLSSYYTNASSTGYQGLFIQCNTFNQENTNFDANIFVARGEVKKKQGFNHPTDNDLDESAANIFDVNMLSGEKAFTTYYTHFDYKYYYNMLGDNTDITGYTSENVETYSLGLLYDAETCPSELYEVKPVVSSEHILIKKDAIISKQDELEDLIDGGNTDLTLLKVQNLQANNFNKTCRELLEISPYISDTVLTTFMQTDVSGFVTAKTNVLLANSPLPPNAKTELKHMNLPVPHKNLVYQNQSGTNAMIIKKEEIGQLEFEKDLLTNEFIRYRLQNDSIMENKEEVMNFLLSDDNPEIKRQVIPILIAEGDYTEAENQLIILENSILENYEINKEEYYDFAELHRLIINTDTITNDENYLAIIEDNREFIENIALNPNHKCNSQAQTLLSIAGLAKFEPEFIYPLDNRSTILFENSKHVSEHIDLDDLIDVYPTPASTELWIEYLILNGKAFDKVEIFDMNGKLISTQYILNDFGIERIDISNLSNGNYMLKLGDTTKQISIIK